MRKVLEEIDQVLRCVPDIMPFRFLDLGCCPGGFTSYILSKNPHASGVGISLPVERGGHACLLEEPHLRRFELHWADLTQYQLGPLIVGLVSASVGGTIVLKQSKPERLITAQLIFLLDVLCADVRTWKPICMHSTRSTFYLVGKAFRLGWQAMQWDYILGGLMNLWVQLCYAGPDGKGRKLLATDLDFIVNKKTLATAYAPRLRQLSEHIWTTQSKCLEGWRTAQAEGF
ncbi:hypothetical protein B0H14DRAFT_3644934 [Mycena olivaceomarginata]|nr:hypothetical protein B0H14DRAFT_3644934 [Mycena olivaceomarginata]